MKKECCINGVECAHTQLGEMKFADSPRFLFYFAQICYNRQVYYSIVVAAATRYRQRAVGGVEALELSRMQTVSAFLCGGTIP